MELKSIIENNKTIYQTDSSVNLLLDFERVLDEVDLYAFKNWIKGELVEGPVSEKYWITCRFMYPYKMMPDPDGAKRLLDYNCKVSYSNDVFSYPTEVDSPADFKGGTKLPKTEKKKIWIVSIVMPKELLSEVKEGFLELETTEVDLQDLDQAYEDDIDEEGAAQGQIEGEVEDDLDAELDLGF